MRCWLGLTRKVRTDREAIEYVKAQQQFKLKCEKADSFRDFKLIVAVMRSLKQFTRSSGEERALEREHEQRKNQID